MKNILAVIVGILLFPVLLLVLLVPSIGIAAVVLFVAVYCYIDDKKRSNKKGG